MLRSVLVSIALAVLFVLGSACNRNPQHANPSQIAGSATTNSEPVKSSPASPDAPQFRVVAEEHFCVTSGRVSRTAGSHALNVNVGGMRGVVAGGSSSAVELAFTYRGPSKTTAPLGSGELRRQIGVKLRAADSCNVVYAMWHIEPTSGIFVSVKNNPGQTRHAECHDHGYINIRPESARPAPRIQPDEPHALRAEIEGERLRVTADGASVWEGVLPKEAFTFDGPAGVRSDNGEFDFEVRVPHPAAEATCRATSGAEQD